MQIDFACEHIHRRGSRRSTKRVRRRNYPNSCGEISTRILHRTFRVLARSNARKLNANRYAYAGDDPINLDPAGANLVALSCASEISVGAAAILAGIGTGVAAGLADIFSGGVAILASAGEAVAVAGLVSGGVLFIGDGINSSNGTGISR